MKSTSIVLSEHWQTFTAELVASGRYGSVSEVVREGLRLVEERQRKIDHVRGLIEEGEASGPPIDDADLDAFFAGTDTATEVIGRVAA